jgi:hypothetical protein
VTEQAGFGFNDLHAEERGLLLGLSLLAMDDAVLSHLGGNRRQACGKAWQAMRALSRRDRAALLAEWIVEANAPFPPGMERLHPSWLAETVASEPVELWPALLCGLPGLQTVEALLSKFRWEPSETSQTWPPDSVLELQRLVFGRLAPFCVGPSGPLGAGLCRLGCEELRAEVARQGAALCQELRAEGDASLWSVAGRLPVTLGRQWVKW